MPRSDWQEQYALAAGCVRFLLNDVTPEHLVAAVRLVRAGALLAPMITRCTATWPLSPARTRGVAVAGERAEQRRTSDGLHLSEATVKTYVARILAKLHLRDRAQAVVVAYETDLITPGSANPTNHARLG